MKVLIPHSCLTLWDLTDCSSPGSSVHGILQARILESVAISFSRGSSWPRDQTGVSCIAGRFFTTLTTREALESTLKDEFHQIVRVMEILRVGCHPFSQSKGFYLAPVFTVMDVSLNKNPLHFNQRSWRKGLKNYWFRNIHVSWTFLRMQLDLVMWSVVQNWSSLDSQLTHWKRLWCWEGLGARGEGDDRGWDGWMASLTQWMWVWVSSGSWWWIGRPGVLQFMGSQRVGHDWATELDWTDPQVLR